MAQGRCHVITWIYDYCNLGEDMFEIKIFGKPIKQLLVENIRYQDLFTEWICKKSSKFVKSYNSLRLKK